MGWMCIATPVAAACASPGRAAGGGRAVAGRSARRAAELLARRDWLAAHGVTQVAMESTGVYWKPVYYLLEEGFTVLLVNAAHVKAVPGRKTDVADSAWLAQLPGARARCGAASCRPHRSANSAI